MLPLREKKRMRPKKRSLSAGQTQVSTWDSCNQQTELSLELEAKDGCKNNYESQYSLGIYYVISAKYITYCDG